MFRRCAVNPIYFRLVASQSSGGHDIDYHINLLRNVACSRQDLAARILAARVGANAGALLNHLAARPLGRSSKRLIEPILIALLRRGSSLTLSRVSLAP